jgi:hypothetical protein
MPGGGVPDQHKGVLASSFDLLAEPLQKVSGELTHWSAIHEAPSAGSAVAIPHPIAAQRCGIGVLLTHVQFL